MFLLWPRADKHHQMQKIDWVKWIAGNTKTAECLGCLMSGWYTFCLAQYRDPDSGNKMDICLRGSTHESTLLITKWEGATCNKCTLITGNTSDGKFSLYYFFFKEKEK